MLRKHHPHDSRAPCGPDDDTYPAEPTAGNVRDDSPTHSGDAASEDGASEDGAPEDGAPEDGTSEDGASEDRAAEDVTPGAGDEPTVLLRRVEPDAGAAPIFVDTTGRRSRWLRNLTYAAGVLGLGYAALVGVSLTVGSTFPQVLIPFPDQVGRSPTPASTPAQPTVTGTAPTGTLAPAPSSTGRRTAPGQGGRLSPDVVPTATVRPPTARPGNPVESQMPTSAPPVPATPAPSEPNTEPTATPTPPAPDPGSGESGVTRRADPR